MQGVRWRPHLLVTHAVPHRVSHFEEKKMLLLYCHDREPLTQNFGRFKTTIRPSEQNCAKVSWARGRDAFRHARVAGPLSAQSIKAELK